MLYPLALRTKRIVFLVALLCPSVTLAYMAIPHGDDPLRNAKATARTQDIVIDSHALPTARSLFMAGPANPLGAMTMARTAADNAAIDELAYASVLSGGAISGPSVQRDRASSSGSGGGSSANRNRRRGSASEAAFANHAMSAGGAGWGGATGSAARQSAATPRVASTRPVKQQAAKAERPPRNAASAPSTGGSSGRAESAQLAAEPSASPFASAAPVATIAALTPNGAPVFSSASSAANGVVRVTTSKANQGGPSPSPAPEPMTLLLMGTGLAGVYAGRRAIR